ncbi:MAG: hypothetical protein JO048_01225 [Methylobacteriaceae bacterium]|nr:hypothetical protein [Methylobacteriaceae bacterium]
MTPLDRAAEALIERGDLAHLALALWAGTATLLALTALKALAEAQARFDAFVAELQRFNRRHQDGD